MKLEKEVYIDTYGLSLICFNEDFTQDEIKKLQQMYKRKIKLTLELEEPILDEAERKYLSGVIRPFRDGIESIVKEETELMNGKEYIKIYFKDSDTMNFKFFEKDTMYKNMELNKEYTLDDLNL